MSSNEGYLEEVRSGAVSPESALRQLNDEFDSAIGSLTRIRDVFEILDESEGKDEIETALESVTEAWMMRNRALA